MAYQLTIGLLTEGTTDIRFLKSIVKKTFDELAFECNKDVEILDVQELIVQKTNFVHDVLNASKLGMERFSINILCVHADADNITHKNVIINKFEPANNELKAQADDKYCKTLVGIIPIQMTEAWMLADKAIFKEEIGSDLSDEDLGIHHNPESYTDPKNSIEGAIRISREKFTKRRRKDLNISELYLPLGQKINLKSLKKLDSFMRFFESSRSAIVEIGLIIE